MTWVAGKCFLGSGWGAVVRDLGLQAGQRVLLEAISKDPWQLKITVLAGTSFLGAPGQPASVSNGVKGLVLMP